MHVLRQTPGVPSKTRHTKTRNTPQARNVHLPAARLLDCKRKPEVIFSVFILLLISSASWSQSGAAAQSFAPLDRWKSAILAGDSEALQTLFSTTPAPQISIGKDPSDVATEINFWKGLKASGITIDIVQTNQPQPGIQVIVFQAEVHQAGPAGETVYVTEGQGWQQQSDQWRLILVSRSGASHLQQPTDTTKNLYPDNVNARAEIKEAEEKAAKERKRVLLVFGANWCFDCHVLDLAFHRTEFLPVVDRYEVVHIDIGADGKKNADLAKVFQVPLDKGVPALAVVDGSGKLLVSQKNGEFENARAMTPAVILDFLNKWKVEAQ
jgi:thioredoxin 1